MQTRHDQGSPGRVGVARLEVAQAPGFAGTHGASILRGRAFRFLPFTPIPDGQPLFALLLPGVHLLTGWVPQLVLDHLRRPFGRRQPLAQALAPRRRLLRAQQIAASCTDEQTAHVIARREHDLDRLHEGAHQPFVHQALQGDSPRKQQERQVACQALCHLLCLRGGHWRHVWREELLSLPTVHLL